ncbi:MAG: hypothetical protein IJW77_07335 [Clostridia bacterium]|nr:hypothetical protein [Clostridia bacterium]
MAYASAPDSLPRQHDRFPLINRRNIHPSRYTQSLISEALRVGMIPIELVDDIQMQVRGVLEDHLRQARREHARAEKTAGDEDVINVPSVDEALARSMLDSIFYSLDTYLRGFHDPLYAINALQGMAVDEMFRAGQKMIKSMICESVALHVQAKKTRITTDNAAYNVTLDEEIHAYLGGYRYQRAGHEVVLPLTYPLSDDVRAAHGIHRLHEYLSRLVTENRFAALFEPEEKALLLASYAKQHRTTTQEMHVNLYDVIVRNALGAAILGKYPGILVLTEEEIAHLTEGLHRKTTRELEHMAADAIRTLIADLHPEPSVAAYVGGHAKRFVTELLRARDAADASLLFVPSDPQMLFMQ